MGTAKCPAEKRAGKKPGSRPVAVVVELPAWAWLPPVTCVGEHTPPTVAASGRILAEGKTIAVTVTEDRLPAKTAKAPYSKRNRVFF